MKNLLFFIAIICFCSCWDKKDSNILYCQVESQIDEYPDSSFFSKVTCMTYDNGKLYVLDKKRGDIVELSDDLKNMNYVCRHGEAPYETVMPLSFGIQNDTIYVVDFGTRSMKKFYKGVFSGNFSLKNANENRFSLNDSLVFLSATTDSTSFLIIDIHNPDKQIPAGKVIEERSKLKTIITNKKYILYDGEENIFSVSDCNPLIEQYDIHGKYIKTYDISSIPVIKESAEYAKKISDQENSVYRYIMDAYLTNDNIYILCSSGSPQEEYSVNTILKLSISNGMKNISTFILPHKYYSSFCVEDMYIFAAREIEASTIEKINMSDVER